MRDTPLVEPFAVPEYFVDGFAEHQIVNGLFTFAAYRIQSAAEPMKVVTARFVMRVADVVESHARTRAALALGHHGLLTAIRLPEQMLS